MQVELKKIERELKIRNYSLQTIKSYLYGLREYFEKGDRFIFSPRLSVSSDVCHQELWTIQTLREEHTFKPYNSLTTLTNE